MDAMAGLLDGPRARQAFLLRALMAPPWSVRVQDGAPLCVIAVLRGEAWITLEGREPVCVPASHVALVRSSEPYAFEDPPGTPPQVIALPGGECVSLSGESLADALCQGVRTWGNDPDGDTEWLIGTYETVSELGRRLLAVLPPLAVVAAEDLDSPLVELLANEIVRDEPGQQVVLDRLLDLLAVSVLRAWFARPGVEAPGWFHARSDPIVGPALRLLAENPAHRWTVSGLAAEVGASRATLARRFTELVGEPPMTFLTERRLSLASDLLAESGTSVGEVAEQVGYSTAYAFSTAFKRFHGLSPQQHRRAQLS